MSVLEKTNLTDECSKLEYTQQLNTIYTPKRTEMQSFIISLDSQLFIQAFVHRSFTEEFTWCRFPSTLAALRDSSQKSPVHEIMAGTESSLARNISNGQVRNYPWKPNSDARRIEAYSSIHSFPSPRIRGFCRARIAYK